jgi:hypothetical protein
VLEILDEMRTTTAVYWPPAGYARDGVSRVFGPPVEVAVRWADMAEAVVGATGEQVTSRAKCWGDPAPGGVAFAPDGALFHGTLAQLGDYDLANPLNHPRVFSVLRAAEVPTLEGDQFVRVAWV